MLVPTIVMSAVIVPMNYDIASIMNHDLRGRRDSAQEQCPTQNHHSHLSLLRNPGQKRGNRKIVSWRRSPYGRMMRDDVVDFYRARQGTLSFGR